ALMINIGGEGETDYVGFLDFRTDGPPVNSKNIFGDLSRPITQTLPDRSVSDLCMRSTPITHAKEGDGQGEREIVRIARPGCRFTFATNTGFFAGASPFLFSIGAVIEDIMVPEEGDPLNFKGNGLRVVVIVMRGDGRFTSQGG